MTTEVKRLIQVRVDKGASFKRDGYGKKRQLSDSWRKPRGQHNKQREQKKAKGALPKPGYGSPIAVRGMHPSGFFEVLVSSTKELEGLDPKTQAVRISATVGDRKRVALQDAALAAGLKVLNARTVKAKEKKAPAKKETKADEKKPAVKSAKSKAAPAKKDAKKEKPASKPEEKKAPAKKAAAKPKAEEKKPASKPEEKKAPAKKAAAKPKAEEKKPAEKPAAKKTAKSGVKKNE
ncbi:50S ribosomal protein L32e [Methanoregula sp.]|uniref:50S ribosomal protein L32e n=1 Tax=Methanoregula sp. TaxID=2052170 RepID=UPI0023697415|nr:50S ribosomal protein L32e [Methanoregula sp.]MDD1687801.1 50S ribosomal protein L32e [Methanoregula sp.]